MQRGVFVCLPTKMAISPIGGSIILFVFPLLIKISKIMRTENEKYCFNCGKVIDSREGVCSHCQVTQPDVIRNSSINMRWVTTLLLCWILGFFGAHRFYLGRVGSGILMLISFGGFGIWYLIDLIVVITGNFKDENGVVIRHNNA